jgi:hypothetical protein
MDYKLTPLRPKGPEAEARARAQMMLRHQEREAREAMRSATQVDGVQALKRLLPIARSDTGQSSVVARFLLNLYNGDRFPFDMTDFRRLDFQVFDDCMAVLKMDFQPQKEVHLYFDNGGVIWEQMAKDWRMKDFYGTNWRRADN